MQELNSGAVVLNRWFEALLLSSVVRSVTCASSVAAIAVACGGLAAHFDRHLTALSVAVASSKITRQNSAV